jgi:hypothetical protein
MNAIPLSKIRNLTVEAAIAAFDDTIDKERAAQYPYAYGVIDSLNDCFNLSYIRFRTCENIEDCISRLPPLPECIPANARQGEEIMMFGMRFVVLENHGDDINEIVLSPNIHVDVLL